MECFGNVHSNINMNDCDKKHGRLCHRIDKKISLQLDAIEKATTIQAIELDRRLDILNHHQAELKSFQDQFVRYDRYEDRMHAIDSWIESAKKDLNRLVVEHERRISKANWIAIVAIGVSVISVIFHFFYNMKGG